MSGLLIRYAPDEEVLRSTGAPPNGILSIAHPDGERFAFAVDPCFEPAVGGGLEVHRGRIGTTAGVPDGATVIETLDVVIATASEDDMSRVWEFVYMGLQALVRDVATYAGALEELGQMVEFACEVRDAADEVFSPFDDEEEEDEDG